LEGEFMLFRKKRGERPLIALGGRRLRRVESSEPTEENLWNWN